MLYKPGYKTSEFWLALSQQILALLVVAGYLSTEQADNLVSALPGAIVVLTFVINGAVALWRYIESREAIKTALVEAKK